ncbi:malate:quinone oxidoreductase [Agromyces aerolatus]|uniref:malate:quinone oxidoreductase n=1 Tax=Agromyces sp. LY-1074 TaxID=3074080 RepID=UPI00285511A7|nr:MULTISPECIES: malate:quinone oxidoreductase [unclassified Agromyces]MDR5701464.1 malate:quinone oxidoreductase [Agromyces sp. LY-1074]MDR5704469.1 malate:quinone oxidoreductase [Agromyces sp. LY-1358]
MHSDETVDVVLIGGGIMSATLGSLISRLQPDWTIRVYERLGEVAQESSNPWNNAGTGHAALCELNYMPEAKDGSVDPAKAISINEQFQISRQYWAHLVAQGDLPEPSTFINSTPHMTFVKGAPNVKYLRRRYAALKDQPLFAGMEYTEDLDRIAEWTPLLAKKRNPRARVAATRIESGTDVDFGSLTRSLFDDLEQRGAQINTDTQVTWLDRQKDGSWKLKLRRLVGNTPDEVRARFVFVGAGGGALALLQHAGIPEIEGFGGFPISGQFLRTTNPKVVAQHKAKVYGKAAVGAPPMSVPHLDTRIVDGETALLFGPYAGFTPKFLKSSTWFDLPFSVRLHNIGPMLQVGLKNFDLVKYLVGELLASRDKKMAALRQFMPTAKKEDWELITAGQRVQVMKKDPEKGGVLQFGTEVITGADGSIAGLLGASPGASTAAPIMLELLKRCFPDRMPEWEPAIREMIPSYGRTLNGDPAAAAESLAATAKVLKLTA